LSTGVPPGTKWVILHLSLSNVSVDSRILREIAALREGLKGSVVAAFGFGCTCAPISEGPTCNREVSVVSLWSIRLPKMKNLRHLCCAAEAFVRMVFECLRRRPHVVHCHDYAALPAGWIGSVLCGARLVYDAHELESEQDGQGRALRLLVLLIERWCWPRVSLMISVSPSIVNWYRDHLGAKSSILVLNSPSDGVAGRQVPLVDQSRSSYFRKHFSIPSGVPVFVYLGLMSRGRGLETVLAVFRTHGIRSHLVCLGAGDDVGVGEHAARFPNIHIHPPVPHDQVVDCVRGADCGLCLIEDVCLSYRYCLPNKLLEYAFAGIPVLASRLPEIQRVVEQYGLGTCCDGSEVEIAAAVRRIEREGITPPRLDLEELSWERQAKRLVEAYELLLQ
jgi:glycosyltransferase involved in cell wall biosynthesis